MLHGNKSYALHSNYQSDYLIAVSYDSLVALTNLSLTIQHFSKEIP